MENCQKVWKSAETILPFSCCPLVFLWEKAGTSLILAHGDTRALKFVFMCFAPLWFMLGVFQGPLKRAYFCKSIAIQMGGVSRYKIVAHMLWRICYFLLRRGHTLQKYRDRNGEVCLGESLRGKWIGATGPRASERKICLQRLPVLLPQSCCPLNFLQVSRYFSKYRGQGSMWLPMI